MLIKIISLIIVISITCGSAAECQPETNQNGIPYDIELAQDKKDNPWKYDNIPDQLQKPGIHTPWPKIGDSAKVYWNPSTDRYYFKKAINKFNLASAGFDVNWVLFEGWEVKVKQDAFTSYVVYSNGTLQYDPLDIVIIPVPQKSSPHGYFDDVSQTWIGLSDFGILELRVS